MTITESGSVTPPPASAPTPTPAPTPGPPPRSTNPIVGPKAINAARHLGWLGVGLLLITLVATAYENYKLDSSARCSDRLAPVAATDKDNPDQLRIVDTWPGKVQLGSRLCVAVVGVAAAKPG